jgi:hypothetical protein
MTSHELRQESPLVVVVQRWKRYGHDRAYVKVDGVQIGYRDLVSSVVHCALPEHRSLIEHATASLAGGPASGAPPTASERPMPVSPASERPMASPASERPMASPAPAATAARALLPDQDLALVRAGSAVRSQAVALRQAAPVRTMLSRMRGVKTDERAWRIGADAEEAVAQHLTRLGPGWHVLHAVPVGDRGSDIDHVVIGPPGVFTVNTKNRPNANVWVRGDTFKVNGRNQRYIHYSRFEARRAAGLLSAAARFDVEVRGVIAVLGAQQGFAVKEQPKDGAVTVVTGKSLGPYLTSLPAALGTPSIEWLYACARHLATWQPRTVQWLPFDVEQ